MPKRIQLRRTKGWRKPEGAAVVSRPAKWGNPFSANYWMRAAGWTEARARDYVFSQFRACVLGTDSPINPDYKEAIDRIKRDIEQLRGKDLCCWCSLDQPCHADVLLDLANR